MIYFCLFWCKYVYFFNFVYMYLYILMTSRRTFDIVYQYFNLWYPHITWDYLLFPFHLENHKTFQQTSNMTTESHFVPYSFRTFFEMSTKWPGYEMIKLGMQLLGSTKRQKLRPPNWVRNDQTGYEMTKLKIKVFTNWLKWYEMTWVQNGLVWFDFCFSALHDLGTKWPKRFCK